MNAETLRNRYIRINTEYSDRKNKSLLLHLLDLLAGMAIER